MFSKINKKAYLLLVLSFILLFFLQWHNINNFPVSRGFDAGGHIEYINYLKIKKAIPLPYEGFELYQPPLYYLISLIFPYLYWIKFLGFVFWLLLVMIAYFFYQKIIKNYWLATIGTLIVSSLPAIIYMSPSISNEFFSAVIISIVLVYYLTRGNYKKIKTNFILGIFLGLAILSKATAFVLVGAIFIDILLKNRNHLSKSLKEIFIPFLTMTVVGSWFYIRNIYLYGNPFISSFNFPQIHPLTQSIVPRSIKFFTDMKGFFTFDLFRSHHYSFWPGTYFSWFYDGHNIIVPVQKFSKVGNLLVIMSIPIFIFFIIGFVIESRKISSKNLVLILYSIFLFISYILYNFKLPFYSTVKGSFLISSIIPFGYFFIKGIEPHKKYLHLISLYFFIYSIVIIKNFWILPWWYKQ